MTYRDPSPPAQCPRRLVEVGETVAPTAEACRLHRSMWEQKVCTQDQYRPYAPPPSRGVVESVQSEVFIRLLNVRWEDGTVTCWEDDSLDPIAGR